MTTSPSNVDIISGGPRVRKTGARKETGQAADRGIDGRGHRAGRADFRQPEGRTDGQTGTVCLNFMLLLEIQI